jgi:hypothetical protein
MLPIKKQKIDFWIKMIAKSRYGVFSVSAFYIGSVKAVLQDQSL